MKTPRILALHVLREHLRSQGFLTALGFAGVLIYVSVLLGALAVDQEVRVLEDFGLSFIELMGLALVVFGAANGIVKELETKTIYLILSRPVSRGGFLLGRYLGLLLSAALAVGAMSLVHLSLLFLKGWSWQPAYALAILGILLKLTLSTALALFLALLSTSVLSAVVMTGIAWILGHFIPEMRFMIEKAPNVWSRLALSGISRVIPDLQLLNFRDRLEAAGQGHWLALGAGYALLYSSACLVLAYGLFRKREF